MPDNLLPGETPAPAPEKPTEPQEPASAQPAAPAAEPAEEPFDQARAMKLIDKFRAEEKEWKKQAKELETLRTKETARAEAEMTEAQKLQAQADKLTAENATLKADLLRREVVTETGLPPILADRLQGATKEELLADAAKLLEVLPKLKPAPPISPTNPANGQQTETDAQKRERLFGKQGNPFDLETIKQQGGGVYWPGQK